MKFRKMSVPFAPQPGISGIFGRMESALSNHLKTATAVLPFFLTAVNQTGQTKKGEQKSTFLYFR